MKKKIEVTESVQTHKPYTPQLNAEAVFYLRRLSWQQGKPMTQTLNALVLSASKQLVTSGKCFTCNGTKEKCLLCKSA